MVYTVDGADSVTGDPLDGRGDQVGVGMVQRRQERAGDHRALGHDAVAGQERLAGGPVVHGGAQQQPVEVAAVAVIQGHEFGQHRAGQPGEDVDDRHDHGGVHQQATEDVHRTDEARHLEQAPQPRRDVEVDLGQYPRRSALVHIEIRRDSGQRPADLHAAGPGADHRDALAADVVAVVPGVGAQDGALEILDAVDVDDVLGVDVTADRTDQEPGRHVRLVADREPPQAGVVVPLLAEHLGVGPQVRTQPQLVGGVSEVGVDLGSGREEPAPVGVGGEGQLVPR